MIMYCSSSSSNYSSNTRKWQKITKCRGHEVVRQVRSAHPKSCFQPSSEGTGPRWAVFGMSSCARGSSGTLLLDTGGRSRLSNVPFNSRSLEPIHNRQRASARGSHDPERDCRNTVAPHLCDHERELGCFMATLARRATRSEPDWACVVGVGGRHYSARSARHVTGSDFDVWSSLCAHPTCAVDPCEDR